MTYINYYIGKQVFISKDEQAEKITEHKNRDCSSRKDQQEQSEVDLLYTISDSC